MPRGIDKADLPQKACATCGRPFAWRKKWARTWSEVRYCSDACRRGAREGDRMLRDVIVHLLATRAEGSSICPSDAARAAFPDAWRTRMDDVRRIAAVLAAEEVVVVLQKGREVDPTAARGPIRLARGRSFPSC